MPQARRRPEKGVNNPVPRAGPNAFHATQHARINETGKVLVKLLARVPIMGRSGQDGKWDLNRRPAFHDKNLWMLALMSVMEVEW